MNRRQLMQAVAAGAAAWHLPASIRAADAPALIIRGGRVIDPANGIDGIRDIGVSNGVIAPVDTIAEATSLRVIDATGLLVVPGLIDVHVHARDAELPPSENLKDGVTTLVDAGSRGARNVDSIIDIAAGAPNRLRLLLNIGHLGNNPGGRAEFLDGIAPADVSQARAAIHDHAPWIVGVKARLSRGVCGDLDKQVLKRAILAAEPYGLPVMIHIGDTASPLPELLALLRPGDIVTHMYAPTANGILDDDGRLLPQVRQARTRGVRFDFGNGLNEHWNWAVAEAALAQDFPPDTISSDLNVPGRTAQVFNLPTVMSKFLQMGMPLDAVIACVTANAAATYDQFSGLGTLDTGAGADIALLELAAGEFEFVDNYQGVREGNRKLVTRQVICNGAVV